MGTRLDMRLPIIYPCEAGILGAEGAILKQLHQQKSECMGSKLTLAALLPQDWQCASRNPSQPKALSSRAQVSLLLPESSQLPALLLPAGPPSPTAQ
jgi:hypothetical protein